MENQYNQLLTLSRTVSDFFENVYAPTLQTLPWLEEDDGFTTVSQKVLGNIAFPSYELSSYKNKEGDEGVLAGLSQRYKNLQSVYEYMQNELQPILELMPEDQRSWDNLKAMLPEWQNMSKSDLLSKDIHQAVDQSFSSAPPITARALCVVSGDKKTHGKTADKVLGHLLAKKIKSMHGKGDSDHSIAVALGTHGFWLDRGFLNTVRSTQAL